MKLISCHCNTFGDPVLVKVTKGLDGLENFLL